MNIRITLMGINTQKNESLALAKINFARTKQVNHNKGLNTWVYIACAVYYKMCVSKHGMA